MQTGTHVVCDRYAFSGVAFSAIKSGDLSYDWCKSCDVGLPAPDLVIFLDLPSSAAEQRGGFGDERYEKSEVQQKVRGMFERIGEDVGAERWKVVDAGQAIDRVESDIARIVEQAQARLASTDAAVDTLWQ